MKILLCSLQVIRPAQPVLQPKIGALTARAGAPSTLQAARPALNNLSIRPGASAMPMNAISMAAQAIAQQAAANVLGKQRQPQSLMIGAGGMYLREAWNPFGLIS